MVWNVTWGGAESDWGYDVKLDSEGNIYVVGETQSFTEIGVSMCLVKFNSEGIEQWNKTDISGMTAAAGLEIDPAGNIIVTGAGYEALPGTGTQLGVIKFDDDGNVKWTSTWGGSELEIGYGIAFDPENNTYISGLTQSYGAGSVDMCLVKLNPDGDVVWSHTWGGYSWENAKDIALDTTGNIYVVGSTQSFGSGGFDTCLLKFKSNGNLEWSYLWGGSGGDTGDGISLDSFGHAYITGYTQSFGAKGFDILLLKLLLDGTPSPPVLDDILPNHDYDGIIELN